MGYRSDIKAVFYTEQEEKWPVLKLYLDENFPNEEWSLKPIKSKHCYGYVFSADDVKWYPNYTDVAAFNKFVDAYRNLISSGEDSFPWVYEFVRIGEDTTDIELDSEGNCSYLLSVSRSIETDFQED
jgi:hypothetical protein